MPQIRKPVEQRFFEKVRFSDRAFTANGVTSHCLEWIGCTNNGGYGKLSLTTVKPQKWVLAHRWLYERWVGPIPQGLILDHLCRFPPCVNPAHMEPVTYRENLRRARGLPSSQVKRLSAYKAERLGCFNVEDREMCPQDKHLWIPENILMRPPRGHHLSPTALCLLCKREGSNAAAKRRRKRDEAARQGGP